MLESIGDSWHRARQGVVEFGAEVDARANAGGPSALGEVGMLTRGAAAAIAVSHDRLSPDGRYRAYHLDEQGQIQTMERGEADGGLPQGAITVPSAAANLPRLLRQGYAVQQNPYGTVTIWQTDPQKASAAVAAPEKQLAQLYKDGALDKDAMKRTAAETIAGARASEGLPPQKYLEVPPPDAGVYRVRVIADGQAQAQHQLDSAAAVADLAAEQGLPVRMVASAPEVSADARRTSTSNADPAAASTQPGIVFAAGRAPTVPPTQSRVERLTASRGAQVQPDAATMPAQGIVATQPEPASQPVVIANTVTGAAPAELVGAAPPAKGANSTPVNQAEPAVRQTHIAAPQPSVSQLAAPAVLPQRAAHWLEQVQRQAPRVASPMPAAPARTSATLATQENAAPALSSERVTQEPAQLVDENRAQEPETPLSVPGANATDMTNTDTENRAK
jgi:hypothetical protein